MGKFGRFDIIRITGIEGSHWFESKEWCDLDLLSLVSIRSLISPYSNISFHLDTDLFLKFTQRALIKTFIHLDVASGEYPGTWPEHHITLPASNQVPSLAILADDTSSDFVISSLRVGASCIDKLWVCTSIAVICMAKSNRVMAGEMWLSLIGLQVIIPSRCGPRSRLQLNKSRSLVKIDWSRWVFVSI